MGQLKRDAIEVPPGFCWGLIMYLRKLFNLLPVVCKMKIDGTCCEIHMVKMDIDC
jgi:hypothetical protein